MCIIWTNKEFYINKRCNYEELREIRLDLSRVCSESLKDGLMQEETCSILYQRTQNGYNKKSVYGLMFLP
jgi:hypothetical protein